MKFSDLKKIVASGAKPVFRVVSIGENETCIEPGMVVRVDSIREYDDGCLILGLDIHPYEAINKPLLRPDYFDRSGKPTLTAIEAGQYPAPGCLEEFWVGDDDPVSKFLEPFDDAHDALFKEYLAANSERPFVTWLVEQLLAARRGGNLGPAPGTLPPAAR